MSYLTTVSDVVFIDGSTGPCYALVGDNGSAVALSIREAVQAQEAGTPFSQPHPVYPGDFTAFFPPDFPQVGRGGRLAALGERTGEEPGGPESDREAPQAS